jgi:hypothetical protein
MEFDLDIERKKKKQKIMAVYGAVFLVLVVLIVLWFTPDPTCNDGKKNGVETGVDCGGLCRPCEEEKSPREVAVQKTAFVVSGEGVYDLVVWINNPNEIYGARSIRGSFLLFGSGRKALGEIPTESFLLPRETKYIVSQGAIPIGGEPVESIEWKPADTDWVDMEEITGIRMSVVDRKYEELTSGSGFSAVSGLLKNESTYDWNDVVISILLFDSSGNLLATHGTSRQTFRSEEKWDFRLIFPMRFPGEVTGVDMQVETNVFNNSNFLKANVSGGAFQNR